MPNKKTRRMSHKPKPTPDMNRSRGKQVMAAILMLSIGVTGVILAQWRSFPKTIITLTALPTPSPTPQLSKEYIYAGGKLVAIEEPNTSAGSGPAPTNLLATAASGTSVSLTWTAPTGSINSYQVERSQSINGPYTALSPDPTTTSFTDSTASAGVAYLYRVRAAYSGGGYSNYSDKDMATTIIFTDDPLTANVTPIKAIHLAELRQAVNAVRATGALSPSTWTDSTLSGMTIKGLYVQELRTSLDQALTALGISTQVYTDTTLPGVNIKKIHVEELRNRVK